MIKIDEYLKKRISDDGLNIMDLKEKERNLQICMNYLFDYFATYVSADSVQKKLIEDNEKLEKYRKTLKDYSEDTRLWLINMNRLHKKRMNVLINNILKRNEIFLLLNTEADFRKVSYQCYTELIRKHSFMEDYTEELYEYILDIHRIWSSDYNFEIDNMYNFPRLNEKIEKYIKKVLKEEHVNLIAWAERYADYFSENEKLWDTKAIDIREPYHIEFYNIKKAKNNYFNLDILYSKVSDHPYLKGKKKTLEILVMYFWVEFIGEIDEDDPFYVEYMKRNVYDK